MNGYNECKSKQCQMTTRETQKLYLECAKCLVDHHIPLKSCHWLCNVCILLHSKPETLPNHLKGGFKRTFLSWNARTIIGVAKIKKEFWRGS